MIEGGKRSWYRRISDPLIGPEATAAECVLGWGAAFAAGLYASTLVFAIAVTAWSPGYLKRPLAFGLSVIGIVLGATILRAPAGLAWLPPLYCLKLVAAHAVPDA